MKKVALSLLGFALVGALAFGQDAPVAKINGYVNSGLVIVNNTDGTTFQQYGNDAGVAGYRSKLTGSIAGSNYGITSTIEVNNGVATVDPAYGWVSPIEGLKLEAGTTNSNPLGELDDNGKGYFGAAGVAVDYTNSGFTVGAVANPGSAATKAFPFILGARYALPNVATVNVTLGNDTASQLNSLYATASLTAVPGLTLTAGYNSTAMATTALTFIDVKGAYAITDMLSAGVTVYAYTAVAAGSSTYQKFKPFASYNLGGGLTASAYLQGDTQSNPNYEPQAELDYVIGGGKIASQVYYDTNPGNLSANAKPATTVKVDFIYSF